MDSPVRVVETAKLMQAKLVKARPIDLVSRPIDDRSSAGKKAKKVESPTLKRNETRQTVATPAQSPTPRGQDTISSSPCFWSATWFSSIPSAFFLDETTKDLSSLTKKAMSADAAREANAEVPMTKAKLPVASLLAAAVVAAAIFRRPSKNKPPRVGPKMNASVDAASLSARYFGSLPMEEPRSARYALLTGLEPAKHPVKTLMARNAGSDQPAKME
jgi:hypothetical protein